MIDNAGERISSIIKTFAFRGKQAAVMEAQRQLIPHILKIFAKHDEETVWKYIVTDYALVENETPEPIKNMLHNLSRNAQLRDTYHNTLVTYITPENILRWLRSPEEWLDAEDADKQRERLKQCAETIETTDGGEEWLARQVYCIYQYANAVPEDSTPQGAKGGT